MDKGKSPAELLTRRNLRWRLSSAKYRYEKVQKRTTRNDGRGESLSELQPSSTVEISQCTSAMPNHSNSHDIIRSIMVWCRVGIWTCNAPLEYVYSNVITLWSKQCMPHAHDKSYWNNNKHVPSRATLARPLSRGLHMPSPSTQSVRKHKM